MNDDSHTQDPDAPSVPTEEGAPGDALPLDLQGLPVADARAAELGPLLEWAPIAVAIVDGAGMIRSVNRRLEALFGYPRTELLERPVEVLVPERMRMGHVRMRQQYTTKSDDRMMGSGRDLIGRHKDGTEFPIEAGLSIVPWHGERLTVATVIDVTRRQQAADLLEQRVAERTRELERRRRVADGLRDVLAVLNSDRPFHEVLATIVNQAVMVLGAETVAIYRRAPEDMRLSLVAGRPPESSHAAPSVVAAETGDIVEAGPTEPPTPGSSQPEGTSGACLRMLQQALHEGLPQRIADGGPECGHRILLAVPLTIRSEPFGSLLLAFDPAQPVGPEEERLAEMVADQAALAIENDRIRTRARRAAVTAERTRIARDLHDSVSQTLFSANLISEVLPRVWAKNPKAGNERLEELQQLTRGALAEMRSLLLELRPNVLREVPLPELLRQLGDAFEGRARVPLELSVDAMPDLPPDVRIALYRTAQEALNNVARHAKAGEAKMSLRQDVDGASLIIEDDGGGFRPEAVSAGHLGLRTMHERAEDIGAHLSVTSRPGGGTKVWVRWSRSKSGLVFASAPAYEPSQPIGTTNADADGTERTKS